jgi:hypothetical protein
LPALTLALLLPSPPFPLSCIARCRVHSFSYVSSSKGHTYAHV